MMQTRVTHGTLQDNNLILNMQINSMHTAREEVKKQGNVGEIESVRQKIDYKLERLLFEYMNNFFRKIN